MDLISSKPCSTIHLVAVPYPGRGHINAMINFCKILISKTHEHLIVSVVVTEEWLGLIGSDPKPANIQFVTMQNVVPSERVRGENIEGFIEAVSTKMEEPFERILDGLQLPPTFIVADSIILWVIRVANRRKIPVASLFPMSAMVFDFVQLVLEKSEHFRVDLSERGDEHSDHNAALPSSDHKDPPPVSTKESTGFDRILEAFSWLPKARCLLICTIYELEPQVIDTLRSKFSLPIYVVGPTIPFLELKNGFYSVNARGESDYFQWLDSKPNRSVLYIALGSFIPVSNEQKDELAAGLREAGFSFLWVVRGETQKLEKMGGDLGLIVPWCDQLKVLCHPSIGGFLSHCGWNSIQEGVFAGVPFLTFPLDAEQFLNSKLIAEDWKVGYKLYKSETKGDVVLKEEISALVRKFMDFGCEEGKQMRRRVRELQEKCHGAISEDGSTTGDIKTFVRDVLTHGS